MQRMLVAITLVLLVVTAWLGFTVLDLSSRMERESLLRARDTRHDDRAPPAAADEPSDRTIQLLEARLRDARADNMRAVSRLETRIAELQRALANAAKAPIGSRPDDGNPAVPAVRPDIAKDSSGNFLITEEEMAYFRAVQAKIDRRRRIDGQTRNYLRRIDSLVTRQEIGPIPDDKRVEVERIIRDFVTKNDDLVTRFVRQPTAEVKALDEGEKRERLSTARETYSRAARADLGDVLPADDVAAVAERVFTNPWGLRPRGFNR